MIKVFISILLIFLMVVGCSKNESNEEMTLEQSKQAEKMAMEKERMFYCTSPGDRVK